MGASSYPSDQGHGDPLHKLLPQLTQPETLLHPELVSTSDEAAALNPNLVAAVDNSFEYDLT